MIVSQPRAAMLRLIEAVQTWRKPKDEKPAPAKGENYLASWSQMWEAQGRLIVRSHQED